MRNLLGDVNVLFGEIASRDFSPESSPLSPHYSTDSQKSQEQGCTFHLKHVNLAKMTVLNLAQKSKNRQGHLITNWVILEKHEMATVNFLLSLGENIELIRPSSKPHAKSADLRMKRLVWEMKSPCGRGKYLIRDTIRAASHQSSNIIIDLRRIKLNKAKAHSDAVTVFQKSTAQRMLIIVDGRLFDYAKSV